MLERFRKLLKKETSQGITVRSLRHLAITMHGMEEYAAEQQKPLEEVYRQSFKAVQDLIELQVKNSIPVLTVYALPEQYKDKEFMSVFLDELIAFFNQLGTLGLIHNNKIKISVLGKWYGLSGRAVAPIKNLIDETKDYDGFFLNFCINYHGQEEITDACRIIARQIKAEKLDIDSISKETIKENLYSSYFLPPDIIIKNGKNRCASGLLLWDSPYSEIYFSEKYFPLFTKADFEKAFEQFKKG